MLPIKTIRFSQDSMNSKFSPQSPFKGQSVGHILDKILQGRGHYLLLLLQKYRVTHRNGVWYTINNRSLWVFKQLATRGYLKYVPALQVADIRKNRMTTKNAGKRIYVFGKVGGKFAKPGKFWKKAHRSMLKPSYFRKCHLISLVCKFRYTHVSL